MRPLIKLNVFKVFVSWLHSRIKGIQYGSCCHDNSTQPKEAGEGTPKEVPSSQTKQINIQAKQNLQALMLLQPACYRKISRRAKKISLILLLPSQNSLIRMWLVKLTPGSPELSQPRRIELYCSLAIHKDCLGWDGCGFR